MKRRARFRLAAIVGPLGFIRAADRLLGISTPAHARTRAPFARH